MNFFDTHLQIWFVVLLAVVAFFVYAQIRRKRVIAKLGDSRLVNLLIDLHPFLYRLKQVALFVAIFFLVVALMRPRWGTRLTTEKELGIDLAIVIDISASMNAADIAPSRLKRVVSEVGVLTGLLDGNRFSLVLFAGAAFIQCPLTSDASAIRLFLESVTSDMINLQGTNIEDALKKAEQVLISKFKRNKVVLLFTDGEAHEGDAVARAEALFKKKQIRCFSVGVGTRKGSIIPEVDSGDLDEFKKDKSGQYVKSRLDEKTLRRLALRGGGEYFYMGKANFDTARLAAKINNIEKSRLGERRQESMVDRYQLFVVAGLFFLLFFILLPERRVPHV